MQSFVMLRCVLRKPWGFWDPRELIPTTRTRTTEWLSGTQLPGSKIEQKLSSSYTKACIGPTVIYPSAVTVFGE